MALHQNCSKFTIQHIRPLSYSLGTYRVFIRKFVAATKNLKTNYTFFVKAICLLLIQETRSMTNFSMTLTKLTLSI